MKYSCAFGKNIYCNKDPLMMGLAVPSLTLTSSLLISLAGVKNVRYLIGPIFA